MPSTKRIRGIRQKGSCFAYPLTLFIINIIGLGFGPQLVGVLSDLFATEYGQESLRMALLTMTLLNLWAALHYLLAARTLAADLRSMESPESGGSIPRSQ